MQQRQLNIIVAASPNFVIGNNNKLPWSLPEDFQFFREKTLGHSVIMGRLTWEGMSNPLDGRENIVVTSHPTIIRGEDVVTASTFENALFNAKYPEPVFAIGGTRIYEAALPIAEKIYLTKLFGEFKGDTYFPNVDWKRWKLAEQSEIFISKKSKQKYQFQTFRRR